MQVSQSVPSSRPVPHNIGYLSLQRHLSGRGMSTNESVRPVENFLFPSFVQPYSLCGIINESHVSQSVRPINQLCWVAVMGLLLSVVNRKEGGGENRFSSLWVTFKLRAFLDMFVSLSTFDLTQMGQKVYRRCGCKQMWRNYLRFVQFNGISSRLFYRFDID